MTINSRTRLQTVLCRQGASIRLRNMFWRHRSMTVRGLVTHWDHARLCREIFGYGPVAQREFVGILASTGDPTLLTYAEQLVPAAKKRLERGAIAIGQFRIWHLDHGKLWIEIARAEGMATDAAKFEAHLQEYFTREF